MYTRVKRRERERVLSIAALIFQFVCLVRVLFDDDMVV